MVVSSCAAETISIDSWSVGGTPGTLTTLTTLAIPIGASTEVFEWTQAGNPDGDISIQYTVVEGDLSSKMVLPFAAPRPC